MHHEIAEYLLQNYVLQLDFPPACESKRWREDQLIPSSFCLQSLNWRLQRKCSCKLLSPGNIQCGITQSGVPQHFRLLTEPLSHPLVECLVAYMVKVRQWNPSTWNFYLKKKKNTGVPVKFPTTLLCFILNRI